MTAYTLHSGSSYSLANSGNTTSYNLGVQFAVSQSMALTGIWYYSSSGATGLPTACALYNANSGTQIGSTLNSSPTWSGAAGSGWVKCTYDGTVTLSNGINYVSVVCCGTTKYSQLNGYWTSGGGASGLTNGPLSAPSSAGSVNGQMSFVAGSSIAFPTGTATGFDFGVDVEVSTIAGPPQNPVPPPLIPPHPQFTDMLLGEAWQRADWQAQGVADLTVTFSSTSGGVDTYTTSSPWNLDYLGFPNEHLRVLKPAAPNGNYPHAFLIMLPVDADQGTTYGDPLAIAQSLGANDNYNLTIIQPGISLKPSGSTAWYADNPLIPGYSEEKFTLLVLNWIKKNLATTGLEKVYLIGFSRSGLAAQFLQFRHPYLFAAAASWDSCWMMTDYDGTDPTLGTTVGGHPEIVFGTSSNFTTNYQLSAAHLGFWQATGQYATNRIWIGQGPGFQAEAPAYDAALTSAGIPHSYTFSDTGESHAWHTDWVAAALAAIIPSLYSEAPIPPRIPHPMWFRLLQVAAERNLTGSIQASIAGSATGVTAAIAFAAVAGAVRADSSVTGTTAALALAAPAGQSKADGTIAGATAALALTASPGTAATGSSVTGVTAALALAAAAGSVAAGAVAPGVTAALALAAPAGSVSASSSVAGTPAALALGAPAGSAASGTVAAGLQAILTLAAPAGAVSASSSVAGVPAALVLGAPAGTLPAGSVLALTAADTAGGTLTTGTQVTGGPS